jgi:hypothetical protein
VLVQGEDLRLFLLVRCEAAPAATAELVELFRQADVGLDRIAAVN